MTLDTRLRSSLAAAPPPDGGDLDAALAGALGRSRSIVVRRRLAASALAAALVLGVAAAALAARGGPAATHVVSPSPPPAPDAGSDTTAPPAGRATPLGSPVPTTGEPLVNGRYFGFVKSVDVGRRTISFDVAQWFEGEEAVKAAAEDGGESTDDYYVRNSSTELRALRLGGSPYIWIADGGDPHSAHVGTLGELEADVAKRVAPMAWVTVRNGTVTRVEEQWVP